jgi:GT2 family glycosyltransferase
VPDAGWLAAITQRMADADIVQGRTLPDPAQQGTRPFSHSVTVDEEQGCYETCNIAYRRSVVARLGGFHEGFRYRGGATNGAGPMWGEDIDLGWRAKSIGARTAFEVDAVVLHDVRPRSFLGYVRDLRRREGIVLAMARNPGLRRRCHLGVFWTRAHPPALLAAGGLALTAAATTSQRRLAGSCLVLPYLWYRTRVMPMGRRRVWPVTIPLALLADLLEIGVFVRASARHRTVVL